MVFFCLFIAVVIGYSRMGDRDPHLPPERVRHGERGGDPAVRVDRVRRHALYDTADGVPDELVRRDYA